MSFQNNVTSHPPLQNKTAAKDHSSKLFITHIIKKKSSCLFNIHFSSQAVILSECHTPRLLFSSGTSQSKEKAWPIFLMRVCKQYQEKRKKNKTKQPNKPSILVSLDSGWMSQRRQLLMVVIPQLPQQQALLNYISMKIWVYLSWFSQSWWMGWTRQVVDVALRLVSWAQPLLVSSRKSDSEPGRK